MGVPRPARRLPLPLINVTASPVIYGRGGPQLFEDPDALHQSVFEITPLRYGSEGFGFTDLEERPFDFGGAVALSAVALDEKHGAGAGPAAFLGLGLGLYLNEFASGSKLASTDLPSEGEADIYGWRRRPAYLSDGGFSDNIGLYSMVRRMCQHTIVIDASHDPMLRFESYRRMKKLLREDMNVDFTVRNIDELGHNATCQVQADGFQTPVRRGEIRAFPVQMSPNPRHRANVGIKVTYIKLSMNRDRIDNYPAAVQDYYQEQGGHICSPKLLCDAPFPQELTTIINYFSLQFRAYRQLGEHIVRKDVPW